MTTTAEKILIMQAYTAGKNIECSSKYASEWIVTPNPCWDWHNVNYRIKPEKKEPTIYHKVVYKEKINPQAYKSVAYYKDLQSFYKALKYLPNDLEFCYLHPTDTISDTLDN